jgi:hypothetical protein
MNKRALLDPLRRPRGKPVPSCAEGQLGTGARLAAMINLVLAHACLAPALGSCNPFSFPPPGGGGPGHQDLGQHFNRLCWRRSRPMHGRRSDHPVVFRLLLCAL